MAKRLDNPLVVITGAGRNIGRATALAFAKRGAHLVLAENNCVLIDEIADRCSALGGQATAVMTNVTDINSVKILVSSAAEMGQGKIDYWINFADPRPPESFLEYPVETHDEIIRINLLAYIYVAHEILPYFIRHQQGVLVNYIAQNVTAPEIDSVAYNASKGGLEGITASLHNIIKEMPNIHICNVYNYLKEMDEQNISHADLNEPSARSHHLPVEELADKVINVCLHPKERIDIEKPAASTSQHSSSNLITVSKARQVAFQ